MKTNVLIVGAGPVGLTMAGELARYGLSVRIVDKNAARTDKSKALVVWARTLELMDRMGTHWTDSFVSAGLRVEGANIRSGSDQIAHIDLTHLDSPYKFVLMLAQSETERLLEEHLGTFGVRVERQLELNQFQATADGVSCTLAHSDGRQEAVEAEWLIGCDGAHSTVRHQLGMEFQGSTLLNDWILADVHLDGIAGPPEINIYWHSEGVLLVFPLENTRYRIIAERRRIIRVDRRGESPRTHARRASAHSRCPWARPSSGQRPSMAFNLQHQRTQGVGLPFRPGVSRRRCSTRSQSGWRTGHEHWYAGCVQSGVEARAGGEGLLPS